MVEDCSIRSTVRMTGVAKNVSGTIKGKFCVGDVWTWTAIDADSKLIPSWLVGTRDGKTACQFVRDLASRVNVLVQLTMDGHKLYLEAVEDARTFLQSVSDATSRPSMLAPIQTTFQRATLNGPT